MAITLGDAKWFGPRWNALICDLCDEGPAPLHQNCHICKTEIMNGESGVWIPFIDPPVTGVRPWHLKCLTASPPARTEQPREKYGDELMREADIRWAEKGL